MKTQVINELVRIQSMMGIKNQLNEGGFIAVSGKALKDSLKRAYDNVQLQLRYGYITMEEAQARVTKMIDQFDEITDNSVRANLRLKANNALGKTYNEVTDLIDNLSLKMDSLKSEIDVLKKNIEETWSKLEVLSDETNQKLWDNPTPNAQQGEGKGILQRLQEYVDLIKQRDPITGDYLNADALEDMFPTKADFINYWKDVISTSVDDAYPQPRNLTDPEDVNRYLALNKMRKEFLLSKIDGFSELDIVWFRTAEENVNFYGEVLPSDIDYMITRLKNKFKKVGASSLSDSEKEVLEMFQKWKDGEPVDLNVMRGKIRDMKVKAPVGVEQVGKKIPLIVRKFLSPIGDWFYNHFIVYWRQWLTSIRMLITGGKFDYDRFTKIALEKFNKAIQSGGVRADAGKTDIIRVVNALETAPEQFLRETSGLSQESKLYKEIWEKFKNEGTEYFRGKKATIDGREVDLEKSFNQFCESVEGYKSNHPILKDRKFAGLKVLMEEMEDADPSLPKISKEISDGEKLKLANLRAGFDTHKNIIKSIGLQLWDYISSNWLTTKIYTWMRGGTFKTPQEFSNYIAERYRKQAALGVFGSEKQALFGTRKNIASSWLMKRAFVSFVLIPAAFGTLAWFWDMIILGGQDIKGQEEQKDYLFEEGDYKGLFSATFFNYIAYEVVQETFTPTAMRSALDKIPWVEDSDGQSWAYYLGDIASLAPGWTEDPLFWILHNLTDGAEEGKYTPEEKAEKIYTTTTENVTKTAVEDSDKKFEEQGLELKEKLGENDNSEKWEDFYYYRRDIDMLYAPNYRPGSMWDLLVKRNIITEQTKNKLLKNKELKFGLNPAYFYENRDKVNNSKMGFIQKVKNLEIKDLVITQDDSMKFGQQLGGFILDLSKSEGASKSTPFVLLGKDGKKYILKNLPSEVSEKTDTGGIVSVKLNEAINENTISFYSPDYQTLYDAIYDPKKVLVPANFKIPSGSKLTEQNLVRVSLNPITKF